MYSKRSILLISIFSLWLAGCNESGEAGEDGMDAETLGHAECLIGVYTGNADFRRASAGEAPFKLEVNRSANNIIALMSNEDSQQQFCTLYENPDFLEAGNEYNIASDNIQHRGLINHSVGLYSLNLAYLESEEETPEGERECSLSSAQIYRPLYPSLELGPIERFPWLNENPDLSDIEKSDEIPRSFSALQDICNSLDEILEEEETEEVPEAETTAV